MAVGALHDRSNQLETLHDLSRHFYALKDVLRLKMVVLLADRNECTVNEMAEALKQSQPLVSWHLRRLKTAGLVKIRRAGREVYCSLDRDAIEQHQQAFLELIQRS
jgi:ArsR family transcriptional regulator